MKIFEIYAINETDLDVLYDLFLYLQNFITTEDEFKQKLIIFELSDDVEVLFVILPLTYIEGIILRLKKHQIYISSRDITDDILFNNIEHLEILKKAFNLDKDIAKNSLLNSFLKENLTIDIILDKINKNGIKSLTDIDRSILNKKPHNNN